MTKIYILQDDASDEEDNDEFDEPLGNSVEEAIEHKIMKLKKTVKKYEKDECETAFMALGKRKYPDLSEDTKLNEHLRICEKCRLKHADDIFTSSVKMYFPHNVMDDGEPITNHGLKSVCLLPTSMSKIHLQTDDSNKIELDGTLFDDVQEIGLTTRNGDIRMKNVIADQITIGTTEGDVTTDGMIDAKIKCEITGTGNFTVNGDNGIYGRRMDARTEYGDIAIWADCYIDSLNLSSNQGSINVNDMYGVDANFNIAKVGRLSGTLNTGSIEANVGDDGKGFLSIMNIYDDSYINMGKRSDLTIRTVQSPNFNIKVQAAVLEAKDPKLLNYGDIHVNDRGVQVYETSFISNEELPTLHVTSLGKVTLTCYQRSQKFEYTFTADSSSAL